jgi:hypothetical protein
MIQVDSKKDRVALLIFDLNMKQGICFPCLLSVLTGWAKRNVPIIFNNDTACKKMIISRPMKKPQEYD